MRVLLTFIAIAFLNLASLAQTFNGGGGNVPASAITATCFDINVTGVGVINTTAQGLASICFNITHPDVGDLEITLTAPDGTMVPLTIQNGGTGNNYTNTCFSATAANSIKTGTAPFTGSFLPEGWLGAVNNGQNANGVWRLCVRDRRGGSSGSLVNWSLTFNNTPAPMPPPIPTCANTLPANSSCSNATLVCDFNGQCGTTSGSSIQDWPGSGLDGDCFGLNNNSFIKFVASAATATFSVWVPTTSQTLQQGGVQMLFFSGTCNSGPVTVHGCYPRILPYPAGGPPLVSVVTATNLTPGNTYYLMIDGANGDNTTFTIAANTGVNVLNITPAAPSICEGASVNLTATGGNGVYSWSPATYLNTTAGATVTSTPPLGTQTYTVTSTTATGCPLTKDVTVTVTATPPAPTGSVTAQPTCTVNTGTITITAPTGAGLQYSINGGALQTSPIFDLLTPGNYTVTVQNAAGCTSAPSTTFVIAAAPAAPAIPTGAVTAQPTCTVNTGAITITAPTGAGLQYSINGGALQTSPVFDLLTPGNYTVTVQNAAGCTSAPSTTFVIAAAPAAPPVPTGSVTAQPTCTVNTGTITITAPTGAGLQYSINGGALQTSPVFNLLTPGNYTVTVQNAAGCTSAPSTTFVIAAAPAAPAIPTGSVTAQPTCTVNTGSITITAPTGAGLQYSINGGALQTSPVFDLLTPGNYTVTVQNAAGCTSAPSTTFVIAAAPSAPPAPTGSVTVQTDCNINTGTITITAPLGADLQYSINGGTTFQTSPIFPNLAPGSYNIIVQNAALCTSPASQPFVINIPQAQPAKPALLVIQPACPVFSGAITVTSPTGINIEYSRDGINYQTSTTFLNVPAGNYNITARFIGTTCVSAATSATINRLTAADCTTGTDIYFPSAFTPDGDGLNETFGPGPRSSLSLVTNYTLMIFNRYGEMVFRSTNPFQQWNGSHKGKVSANFSYTWTATYRFNGRPLQTKKGTVTIVR